MAQAPDQPITFAEFKKRNVNLWLSLAGVLVLSAIQGISFSRTFAAHAQQNVGFQQMLTEQRNEIRQLKLTVEQLEKTIKAQQLAQNP